MKKILLITRGTHTRVWVGLLIPVIISGCARLKQITQPIVQIISPPQITPFPPYSGPKARIAVPDFKVDAAKAPAEVGVDLRQMFVSALLKSNRFMVAESGALGSDLMVTAQLAEFEPRVSGGRAGVGGGGSAGGALNALLDTGPDKAHIALDIRIIDNSTSKVLTTKRIEGQATVVEKAISICIIEAVRYISQTIPANYYKY